MIFYKFYKKKVPWINTIILVVLIFHILLKSFFHHDGRVSPDSAEYLSAAQSLLDGDGLYTGSNPILGMEKSYFSIWPAGYSLLIALVAFLTKFSVFWAAKLVNVLMLMASAFLLHTLYKEKSYFFITCFGFASYLFLFSSTYSEAPFTFSLIYLSWSLYNFNKENASWSACIHLSIAAILPFLFRYIGVFTCFLLLAILVKSVIDNGFKLRATRIFFVLIITGVFELMYLVINLLTTGHLTGISRPSGFVEPLLTTSNFAKGMLGEIVLIAPYFNAFLMIITLIVIVLAWLYSKSSVHLRNKTRYLSQYFLIVGIIYFISLLVIGYLLNIQTFDYRFLSPGTLLILFSFIDYFLEWKNLFLEISVLSFFILSIVFSIRESYKSYALENLTYSEKIENLHNQVKSIEEGSVIINGNKHYKYLRPDLIILDSWYLSDTITNQMLQVEYPEKKIYLQEGESILRVN